MNSKDPFDDVKDFQVCLTKQVASYLEELKGVGCYGEDETEIIYNFVLSGIRKAIGNGIIAPTGKTERE